VRYWKLLGLAGLAGVAATGVVLVRAERRRQALTPEEVRSRLHERYAAAVGGSAATPAQPVEPTDRPVTKSVRLRSWTDRLLRRLRRRRDV